MSILNHSLLLGADAGATRYEISRSLRFNSSDSAKCARTYSSGSSTTTQTLSLWVKRAKLGATGCFWSGYDGSAAYGAYFQFDSTDTLTVILGGASLYQLTTTQVFRDPSSWYHIVLTIDTNNGTSGDRIRLYVNGSRVTTFSTASYPTSGYACQFAMGNANNTIGTTWGSSAYSFFDGYLADVHFIDGQALDPSSFVETSATTGQLIPKQYAGSFGTNGFWLKFSDNSAATATTLGKDYSGNNNNWSCNNLSVTPVNSYQITGFSGTNGGGAFANATLPAVGNGTNANLFPRANNTYTLSRTLTATAKIEAYCYIDGSSGPTIQANGGSAITVPAGSGYAWSKVNLGVTSLSSITLNAASWTARDFWLSCFIVDDVVVYGTPALAAGCDSTVDTPTSGSQVDTGLGGQVTGNYCTLNPLATSSAAGALSNGNLDFVSGSGNGTSPGTIAVSSGKWYWEVATGSNNLNVGIVSTSSSLSTDLGGTASGYAYYGFNGSKVNSNSQSSYGASWGSGDIIGVALDLDAGTLVFYKNGSSQGTAFSGLTGSFYPAVSDYTGSSGFTLSCNFGQRQWAYAAPAGFKALCDTNLPAPVVAKPSTVMDVKLYTGNGSTQTISGLGFSPDFVWIKQRSGATSHTLHDTIRGTQLEIYSDSASQEYAQPNGLTAFNSDGFTLGNQNYYNGSGLTFAAWAWDAGSSTVTNTQGSITSSVRANASAGFSVVAWTKSPAGAHTVGHGLSVAPQLVIVKSRSLASEWAVYHASLGATKFLKLNTTDAAGTVSAYWNDTAPTSTTISLGSWSNLAGDNIAYCFSPVAGYSSFGSYTGNGSATDGPFVYTGFRPRWVLIKNTGAGGNVWVIYDTARDTYNIAGTELYPNLSSAEAAGTAALDIVSNGFKIRTTSGGLNASGAVYIYAAFAENPFQYARAR